MTNICRVTLLATAISHVHAGYQHGYGHQQQQLQSVPELESYGKIEFPHFDIIDLGSYQKGDIPPKTIHEIKKIVITQPKPYPVKVPHPVPYPVHQNVPYPVIQKEIVKVPEPVPYPVTKTVHVPIEVPKPYPVSVHESGGGQSDYGGYQNDNDQGNHVQFDHNGQDYGNQDSYQPHHTYGVPQQEPGQPLGLAEYQNQNHQVNYQVNHDEGESSLHQEEAQHDQSSNYAALLVPVHNQNNGENNLHQGQEQTDRH